ncbi:DUF4184 family protein [Streptomyces paludis]|uniref:DUF4184 family protein n=1 Tax=Streptomyces paludis TaxID=2282738 RepID=A0A345HT81_9ACTN|nr:DUF4184 family protein [Streptomyces paludis]AXG79905.1 DUF4184 family protein [Streptomyces paludis]
MAYRALSHARAECPVDPFHRKITELPFTLSHPAAVLPFLRPPFVPAALVAGAIAPDAPYFLGVLGVSSTSAEDWYGPLLNATETHSFVVGPLVGLPFTLALVAAYRMLRAPVTALLPAGLRLPTPTPTPKPDPVPGGRARARAGYALWLLISAVIGIVTHLVWDSFTHGDGFVVTHVALLRAEMPGGLRAARLLQYASTAFGLAAIGLHLWRRTRNCPSTPTAPGTPATRLSPAARWTTVALLVASPALGATIHARADFDAYRHITEVDYSRPTTINQNDGTSETTYPEKPTLAPWPTVAEGVLTGATKRAGAAFTVALLLYATTWQLSTRLQRARLRS